MKAALVALAVVTIAALTAAPAEAHRHHRHAYFHSCHHYDDYTKSNALSGMSYIYPAANWGPFFACRMYYSPVVSAPPTLTYTY